MESRSLGKTGLTVSTLGFGCGNVGGLIIRGTPAERERAVARAIELGINYFAHPKTRSSSHLRAYVFPDLPKNTPYLLKPLTVWWLA